MATRPAPAAPRLHCEATLAPGAAVRLSERAGRHIAALRLGVGDALTLFNGDGFECAAVLTGTGKRGVTATVRERRAVDRESPLEVRLGQGVCAGDRMDLVLQKATELGVAAIQPVVTARSVVRLSSDRRERRETHWQNVVIAACEQCGRNRIPQVAASLGFGDYLAALRARAGEAGTRILLAPDGTASLRSLAPQAPVTVLVGPEGGLAPEELEIAVAVGFMTVRFGPRILRTETAPLATLAALQAIYGDC